MSRRWDGRSEWADFGEFVLAILQAIVLPVVAVILLLVGLHLTGLGYSQRGNEAVGQVKFVVNETPILCPNYTGASVNFGLTQRNGDSGTFTAAHDVAFLVKEPEHIALLKQAALTGRLVRIVSDEVRFDLCRPNDVLRSVELLERSP